MRAKILLVTVFAMLFTLGGYGAVLAESLDMFKDEKGTIRIAGGTAHIPVMKEAAKQIMTINPAMQISIAGGGSGVGIKQVGEGLIDIGNSGREPTEAEVKNYSLRVFKWAIDGVGVVVSATGRVHGKGQVEIFLEDRCLDPGEQYEQIDLLYTRDLQRNP
jgi:phosphate transport system substrate-binding protein